MRDDGVGEQLLVDAHYHRHLDMRGEVVHSHAGVDYIDNSMLRKTLIVDNAHILRAVIRVVN